MKCAKINPIFNDIRFFPFSGVLMKFEIIHAFVPLIVLLCVGVLHFNVLIESFLCKEAVR